MWTSRVLCTICTAIMSPKLWQFLKLKYHSPKWEISLKILTCLLQLSHPVSKVGGIWLLWNPRAVNLRSFQITHQVVHAVVTRNNSEEWLVSAVYASPNRVLRKHLWDKLIAIAESGKFLWLAEGTSMSFQTLLKREASRILLVPAGKKSDYIFRLCEQVL